MYMICHRRDIYIYMGHKSYNFLIMFWVTVYYSSGHICGRSPPITLYRLKRNTYALKLIHYDFEHKIIM